MGAIGFLAGYSGTKTFFVGSTVFFLGMSTACWVSAAVFPATAPTMVPAAISMLEAAEASAAALVNPFDPVAIVAGEVAAITSGPV